jgi:hypothetical protein
MAPTEAAVIPFPREETTPPVTKIYLVLDMFYSCFLVLGFKVIKLKVQSSRVKGSPL